MSAVLFPAPLLSVERLSIQFGTQRVVDDVSFALWPGKTLCIAGESGSGKSLTSLAIMGLLPEEAQIPGGAIIFDNQDLLSLPERQMQLLRGKSVAMIFQEPMTSLNPLMTVRRCNATKCWAAMNGAAGSARCWTRSKSVMWRSACNSIRTSFPAVCARG